MHRLLLAEIQRSPLRYFFPNESVIWERLFYNKNKCFFKKLVKCILANCKEKDNISEYNIYIICENNNNNYYYC